MNEIVQALHAIRQAISGRINGLFISRQGGSSSVWGTSGTSNFDTSQTDVRMETGVFGASASPTGVVFPTAFTNAPVVIGQVVTASGANCYCVFSAISSTGFSCQVVTDAGVANNNQAVAWIAIGV